jgi:hypothetical protein
MDPGDRNSRGGVFLDSSGQVRCVWSLFEDGTGLIQAGVPTKGIVEPIRQVISRLTYGTPITLRALEAELMLRSLADARLAFGLPLDWISKMEKASSGKKVVRSWCMQANRCVHPCRL